MVKRLEEEHNRLQEIRERAKENAVDVRRRIREDFHNRVISHISEIYNESKGVAQEYSMYNELRELERFYQTIRREVFSEKLEMSFAVYGEAYSSFRLTEQKIRKKANRFRGGRR